MGGACYNRLGGANTWAGFGVQRSRYQEQQGTLEGVPEQRRTLVLLKEARTHSDVRLVEACRQGDASAFDELVRRYKDRVFNVVFRYLGNREDTLDVCQEAFVRAYRAIDGFQGKSKVYTWLCSIAVNLARNKLRDQGRRGRDKGTSLEGLEATAPGVLHQSAAERHTPSDAAMNHELGEILQGCLEELPEPYRMTFVLRTFEDMSYDEIAEAMDCPAGTVKSRLNQARRLLRDRLTEMAVL